MGIAIGPVMAGVIGTDKFSYDVWGETVNLASRLNRTGSPVRSKCLCGAGSTRRQLRLEPRGPIEVKGVGRLETWLLKEERAAASTEANIEA